MASLFGKKKEQKGEQVSTVEGTVSQSSKAKHGTSTNKQPIAAVGGSEDLARVLRHPRITEKASIGIDRGVYIFDVAPDANKKQIKAAIKRFYNIEPVKVRVSNVPRKSVRHMRTVTTGVKGGGKKAYVYLHKGDTISIIYWFRPRPLYRSSPTITALRRITILP